MALINCPECNTEISDKAPSCPRCGAPMSRDSLGAGTNIVTTQITAKKFKGQQLAAFAVIVLGLVMVYGSTDLGPGLAVMLAGFVWFIVARIMAWWSHG